MRKVVGLLLLIFFGCSKEDSINCDPTKFPDAYDYPIKPGTEEWIALESRDARAQACIISQEILETISTGGLFESLLSYPFILDYGAWEEFQKGFEKLKSENTGFAELFSREDLYKIISSWYGPMSTECQDLIYRPINAPVGIELEIIEMFIFQDEFLNSLSHDSEEAIFKLVFSKVSHRSVEGEKLVATAILGKIMFRNEYIPFINECNNKDFLRFFIEFIPYYRPADYSPTETIEQYAKEYYKSL